MCLSSNTPVRIQVIFGYRTQLRQSRAVAKEPTGIHSPPRISMSAPNRDIKPPHVPSTLRSYPALLDGLLFILFIIVPNELNTCTVTTTLEQTKSTVGRITNPQEYVFLAI